MNIAIRFAAVASAVFVSMSAQAVHVTSLPGSTTYIFPIENYLGAGPKSVAQGIGWSSENDLAVFGYVAGYGFGDNGEWGGQGRPELPMIGTNSKTSSMTLTFDNAVSGVGAFVNWGNVNGRPDGNAPVMAVYSAANQLLESYTLTFITDGGDGAGEFHGFQRPSADVKFITFSGAFIGAANLEVMAAVPEPQTSALMFAGLGLLLSVVRRRRAAAA